MDHKNLRIQLGFELTTYILIVLTGCLVEPLWFEEEDRVLVSNGGQEEPFGLTGATRNHHLQEGREGEREREKVGLRHQQRQRKGKHTRTCIYILIRS